MAREFGADLENGEDNDELRGFDTPQKGGSPDPAPAVRMGVFAKHWTPGRAKTRLASAIGPNAAAEAARRFVDAVLRRLDGEFADQRLAFTPADQLPAFEEALPTGPVPWRLEPQPELPTLGERMRWYFDAARRDGTNAALLVGSDSPDMPLDEVRRAAGLLTTSGASVRLVLGPTFDGGYWLIGVRGEPPPVFEAMPWSTPQLMEATVAALDAAGWRRGRDYQFLTRWYDVDTADDLAAMCGRVEAAPAASDLLVDLARAGRQWLASGC